jgi:hypothetical protein
LSTGLAIVVSTMGLCMKKEPGTSPWRMGEMLPAAGESWFFLRSCSRAIPSTDMIIRSFSPGIILQTAPDQEDKDL